MIYHTYQNIVYALNRSYSTDPIFFSNFLFLQKLKRTRVKQLRHIDEKPNIFGAWLLFYSID